MKIILIAGVVGILTIGAFTLVVMNRSSEKIITAVIPLWVVALLTVFLTVAYLGRQPAIESTFPVAFIYRADNNLPVSIPLRRLPSQSIFLVPQLASHHPERMNDGHNGVTLYHQFLQRAIIELLATYYKATWQVRIDRFDTGYKQTQWAPALPFDKSGTRLTAKDIQDGLRGNRFADQFIFAPEITLPPRTTLSISPPRSERTGLEEGSIVLRNRFVNLSVNSRESSWGPFHTYDMFFSNPEEMDKALTCANFVVTVKASFSRWLSGNPDMPKYKAWAAQISSEIQREFDEQLIWKETKDTFLLEKQREAFGLLKPDFKTLVAPRVAH